jgi:hypothetical protein
VYEVHCFDFKDLTLEKILILLSKKFFLRSRPSQCAGFFLCCSYLSMTKLPNRSNNGCTDFVGGNKNINFPRAYSIKRPPLWFSDQSSWLQNGDVLCFLWGMNWILALTSPTSGGRSVGIVRSRTKATELVSYVGESRPSLWSRGQSSWLQSGDVLFPVRYELNLYMLCRGWGDGRMKETA